MLAEQARLSGRRAAWLSLIFNLGVGVLIFLPYIIWRDGILILMADYNKQQIPFNVLANQQIRNGEIFWSWPADLGTSFIGAYSFYNLGSPFFWLSLLFPPAWIPYVLGPMLILKCGIAGLSSCLYLRRFVHNPFYAVIGSMMYAWSGFLITNLQFNHFHDVAAFFPLFLLALELLVTEKKQGWFALITGLMALINYFFFIGIVVFAVIYFVFRFSSEETRQGSLGQVFLRVLLEGVLGVGLAAVLFLPSLLFVLTNPRSGYSIFDTYGILHGWRRSLMLLRAALFPADSMGLQSVLYPNEFSSIGLYLPVFGATAAFAYLRRARGIWRNLLLTLVVMALVSPLNSFFYALNGTYYARWFFMLSLITVLVTVQLMENGRLQTAKNYPAKIRGAARRVNPEYIRDKAYAPLYFTVLDLLLPLGVTLIFSAMMYLWPGTGRTQLLFRPSAWTVNVLLAVAGGTFAVFWFWQKREGNLELAFQRRLNALAAAAIMIFTILNGSSVVARIQYTDEIFDRPENMLHRLYYAAPQIKEALPREDDYRIYHDIVNWNIAFLMDKPTVTAFISTISGSIFEFYSSIGYGRYVYTYMQPSQHDLQSFLSVRFVFSDRVLDDMELFLEHETPEGSVYVYEVPEDRYLGMGFTMDKYIEIEDFLELDPDHRQRLLLRAAVLDPDSRQKLREAGLYGRLTELTAAEMTDHSEGTAAEDRYARRMSAPVSFTRTRQGFELRYDTASRTMAYLTVPYDAGWTARLNGNEVPIIEANGFMLVPLSEGESELVFSYLPPGLIAGSFITVLSVAVLLWELGMNRKKGQTAG